MTTAIWCRRIEELPRQLSRGSRNMLTPMFQVYLFLKTHIFYHTQAVDTKNKKGDRLSYELRIKIIKDKEKVLKVIER